MFINIPKKHKKPEKIDIKSFNTSLKEGIQIIKNNKLIYTMISLGTLINFSVAPLFSVGLIFIVKEILKATDFQFGLFQSILALSMILAPILCGGIMKKMKVGKLCYLSFLAIGLVILFMVPIPSKILMNSLNSNLLPYILLMAAAFIIGILVTVANISLGTIFDQVTPVELMGRASTVFNLAVTVFIPIGQMILVSFMI